jgi:hypothetical protein
MPIINAPERSLAQRMDALHKANDVRTRKANLKRDLKAGRAKIADVLLEPPEYLENAKVFDLLLAVPKYGRVKVNKVFVQCRISPSKTVGGLSERQRTELLGHVNHNAPHTPRAQVIECSPPKPRPTRTVAPVTPRMLDTFGQLRGGIE